MQLNNTTLSITNNTNATDIDLSILQDGVDDSDSDPINELNLSVLLNGSDLETTDAGGTIVTDLSDLFTAGTGIEITDNVISTIEGISLSIGDIYQGGIIFWLDDSGEHGLVAAISDQNTVQWYNGSFTNTEARGDGVGGGEMNTMLIIANLGNDSNAYAAGVCANLVITDGVVDYGDWYLPSKYELNLMYTNLHLAGLGNFNTLSYWSSTEIDSDEAWRQIFANGDQLGGGKFNSAILRAIRAF